MKTTDSSFTSSSLGALSPARLASACVQRLLQLGRWLFGPSHPGSVSVMATVVRPDTVVLDVGAGTGVFTQAFAGWAGAGGKVIAIEPEPAQFERLKRRLSRHGLLDSVEPIQAWAGSADHPGSVLRLDTLIEQRQWPTVSAIRIHADGALDQILRGAAQTLARHRPAVLLTLNGTGSADAILSFLAGFGYGPHRVEQGRIYPPLRRSEAMAVCRKRKVDFLLLCHDPQAGAAKAAVAA